MKFQSRLQKATLIKRYKRFLTDVRLENGNIITVHCANSGSMQTCFKKGWNAYISDSNNPKRKLRYTLELIDNKKSLICVNTHLANKIVYEALLNKNIPEFSCYKSFIKEVKINEKSRIDLLCKNEKEDCYVEIKSVSMVRDSVYSFPDAVTKRGQKHLKELIELKKNGDRAVIFFLLMRNDGFFFKTAEDIDPEYSALLNQAQKNGVEILIYNTEISLNGINIGKKQKL